jgi:hypothetical protein
MKKLRWLPISLGLFSIPAMAGTIDFTFNDLIVSGSNLTAAYGVNDSGTVTGYYTTSSSSDKFGFYASSIPSLSISTLTLTNGSPSCSPASTAPAGISNSGAIVGAVTGCGTNFNFITANSGASFTDFSPSTSFLPSGYTVIKAGEATGDNGTEIIGYVVGEKPPSTLAIDGYSTTNESTYTLIADPNTGATGDTLPAGINSSDNIVGFYVNSSGSDVGFLLASGSYYDLNAASYTSNASGTFTDATGIDSNGDIVGFYKDVNSVSYGFILSGYSLSDGAVTGGTFTTLTDPNCLDGPSTPCNNGSNSEGTEILGISPTTGEIVGKYTDVNGTFGFYATESVTTPEPDTILLSLAGFGVLAGWGWRRRKAAQ